ncbi:hypothetical protein M9H77_31929 [Catharanthus roseus]|uniref:Uncharacterized protein n=1 Tax=Catharanthus roseus TaxID=4058 RepID=A0ACC0A2R4_CATRO|nr:hypothetical protein M9H77_31929 [Catharanthus roseus]
MPIVTEMMYEARAATGALFSLALYKQQMEDIAWRVIVQEVDRVVRLEAQRQIAYANHILHGVVAGSLGEIGISMSDLGSLEPPSDWQMPSYLKGEGTSSEQ